MVEKHNSGDLANKGMQESDPRTQCFTHTPAPSNEGVRRDYKWIFIPEIVSRNMWSRNMVAKKNSTVRGQHSQGKSLMCPFLEKLPFSHRKTNGKNLMETVNVDTGKARIQSTDSKSNSKQEGNIFVWQRHGGRARAFCQVRQSGPMCCPWRETKSEFNNHQERWAVRMESLRRGNVLGAEDNED